MTDEHGGQSARGKTGTWYFSARTARNNRPPIQRYPTLVVRVAFHQPDLRSGSSLRNLRNCLSPRALRLLLRRLPLRRLRTRTLLHTLRMPLRRPLQKQSRRRRAQCQGYSSHLHHSQKLWRSAAHSQQISVLIASCSPRKSSEAHPGQKCTWHSRQPKTEGRRVQLWQIM